MGRDDSHNQIYLTTCMTPVTLWPFFCKISAKDAVKLSEASQCPKKNDPTSPKISCMGQIKRHKKKTINSTPGKLKYTQLKKMFSARNLLITTTSNTSSSYCKGNKNKKIDTSAVRTRPKFHDHGNCAVGVPLNLAELDPPLPVVKPPCGGGGKGSLWKRRGGVAPLESLQIQQIQLPYNNTVS